MKSRIKVITHRHEKKLYNLRKLQQHCAGTKTKQHPVKQIILNFLSYVLSRDEEIVLWYGLEQHIPSSLNETDIDAEFKQFYQGLLTLTLKTKLHSRSKKYTRIKVRYKYKLTDKNQNIVITKRR